MRTTEIIALICPSCGNTNQTNIKSIKYGYEFKCTHCNTSSLMIINQKLYIPAPGEHVCIICGRVSAREARYCQCGKQLVKKCINSSCSKDIPVDHFICDFCGTDQKIEYETNPFEFLLLNVSNPDPYTCLDSQKKLLSLLETNITNPEYDKWIQQILNANVHSLMLLLFILPNLRIASLYTKCFQLVCESITNKTGEESRVVFQKQFRSIADILEYLRISVYYKIGDETYHPILAFFLVASNNQIFQSEIIKILSKPSVTAKKIISNHLQFSDISDHQRKILNVLLKK